MPSCRAASSNDQPNHRQCNPTHDNYGLQGSIMPIYRRSARPKKLAITGIASTPQRQCNPTHDNHGLQGSQRHSPVSSRVAGILVARRSRATTRHLTPRLRLPRSRLDQPRSQNAIHPAGDRARLRCWLGAAAARSRGLVKVVRTFSLIEYRNLSLCRYRRPGGHLSSY